jgi:hypothetical protein
MNMTEISIDRVNEVTHVQITNQIEGRYDIDFRFTDPVRREGPGGRIDKVDWRGLETESLLCALYVQGIGNFLEITGSSAVRPAKLSDEQVAELLNSLDNDKYYDDFGRRYLVAETGMTEAEWRKKYGFKL